MATSAGLTYALNNGISAKQYYSNIYNFIVNNPNANDTELRARMDELGVSPEDVSYATGEPLAFIQSRYFGAAPQLSNQQIVDYLKTNPTVTGAKLSETMKQYGVTPARLVDALNIPRGGSVKVGNTIYQATYDDIGDGESRTEGPLKNLIAIPADQNKVGGTFYQYDTNANLELTGKQQKVASFTGGLVEALTDPVVLAALGGAAASGLLGGAAAATTGAATGGASTLAGAGTLASTGTLAGTGTALGATGTIGATGLTLGQLAQLDLALGGVGGTTGALSLASTLGSTAAATGLLASTSGLGTGSTLGTGLTGGTSGLGLNATGTAGLGTLGTGAGLTTGTGLGTGVLLDSTLGTGLLGSATTGAGLTGTGILSGSTLGTSLLGSTGTSALTGTGILTGSDLGTSLLGTGTGTAATVGGLGNTVANLGAGALTTGLESLSTGLTGLGTGVGTGLAGLGTGLGTGLAGVGTGLAGVGSGIGTGLSGLGSSLGTGLAGLGTSLATGLAGLGTGLGSGLSNAALGNLLSTGLTTSAGLLQQERAREAAIAAQAVIDAETEAAKQASQFRPVGMTTRFGTSQFAVNPITGQLTSAGYTLSPEAKNAQDRLVKLAESGLVQAEGAQAQFAPLQAGAQQMFNLGQGYLGGQTDPRLGQIASQYLTQSPESKLLTTLGGKYIAQSPEDVAKNYLAQQMALLQPGRELELANLQNRLQQQGRGGLSVAQGGAYGATTPELQALYNARAMQEAQLAAGAQQAGQQQVQFGAGLFGTGQKLGMEGQAFGIDTLAKQQAIEQQRLALGTSLYNQGAQTMGQYYAGQQAAYAPYTTALGQVQGLETAAQQPLTMGINLGQMSAQAGANAGKLGLTGAQLSTALATSPAITNSQTAGVLAGLGASPTFGTAAGGLLSGGLSGLQSLFSQNALGSSGFGSGLAYGNQDLGLFL